jgi:hypothetical protein
MAGAALRRLALCLVAASLASAPSASALTLARNGHAEVSLVIARDASDADRNAAKELSDYLGRVTGGLFPVASEGASPASERARIHVGSTAAARAAGIDVDALGPEAWVIRTTSGGLVLCGGRPRGTLYAVYRFLEDHVGVRWWSPFEEFVPARKTLSVRAIDRTGSPAFAYREISLLDGPFPFCVRNRLNGDGTRIPWAWGGRVAYATPWHVHSFYRYVPPEEYFATHPEYFAERAGFRAAEGSQLCLTEPAVADLIAERLTLIAERAREEAGRSGTPAPSLYDVSHNDWGGWCRCAACEAVRAREGADSGTLLPVVNRAADAVASVDADAFVTTLAYTFTFEPPRLARPRRNVIVELTAWGKRDFARPVADSRNATFRSALERWSEVAPHLWIWDYTFSMGASELGLPYPTWRNYGPDLRLYRRLGVEGMIVQAAYQVPGDLRDLNVWVLAKMMEDPRRSERELLGEFVRGFYGRAAPEIRRYLRRLERATLSPPVLVAETTPAVYAFLDASFVVAAQRLFDQAERAVTDDPVSARRVRHARVALDYATLARWPDLARESEATGRALPFERAEVAARYERTCREQIDFRLPAHAREAEWSRIESEREDVAP